MTSERALWVRARRALAPYGRLVRVENRAEPGTPDVAYCLLGVEGWLELKEDPLPKPGAPIKLRELTLGQVLWAEAWHAAGGRAWLLAQLGRSYALLTPGEVRAAWNGALTAPERWWPRWDTAGVLAALAPREARNAIHLKGLRSQKNNRPS